MMDEQKMNELIKNKINQYDSPIDLDEAWTDLSNRQEKRKKAMAWWFGLGASILIGLLTIWLCSAPVDQEGTALIGQGTASATPRTELPPVSQSPEKEGKPTQALETQEEQMVDPAIPSSSKEENSNLIIDENPNRIIQEWPLPVSIDPVKSQTATLAQIPLENLTRDHEPPARKAKLINSLQVKAITLSAEPAETLPLASNSTRINTDIVPSNRWSIYLQSGIGQTWEQFSTTSSDMESYRMLRNDSETALESVGLALGLAYQLAPKWTWSAGVQYTSAYTRFEFEQVTNPTYELENVLLRIRQFSNGEEEQIFGDTTVIGTRRVQVHHFNHYQSYSLNTMLGYELWTSNRWSIQVAGGLVWNLRHQVEGRILGPSNNEILNVMDDGAIYQRSLNLGFRSSVQLSYLLHPKWSIYAQPEVVIFQGNTMQSDQALKSRLTRGMLNVGVRYRLGKQ
ncbi:MAG: autotransporter outer membrane beta-barrel domain-containing protein [Bacteroidota bacterium]